ncbi:hypothetical protein SAMN00790413_01715 [Deinococcus hopiensis KR-140]|uniref:Uncharacterized protein n=1 Tax=Deinococcus hopiensis KR-140 TaxID=695939 RepID=A0A1W1VHM0_9DEIO|nr:hypothetical protein SAMN00790413_01715 [Deinococcus hopiensis KR-140]
MRKEADWTLRAGLLERERWNGEEIPDEAVFSVSAKGPFLSQGGFPPETEEIFSHPVDLFI